MGLIAAGMLYAPAVSASSVGGIQFASSMSAGCIGGSYGLETCEAIRFRLDIPDLQFTPDAVVNDQWVEGGTWTNVRIGWIEIKLSTSGAFSFFTPNGVLGVYNTSGSIYTPPQNFPPEDEFFVSNTTMKVDANAFGTTYFSPSPLWLDVRIVNPNPFPNDLFDLSATYLAGGTADEVDGAGRSASFSAAGDVGVVPEPMSMVLLGTGLAGIAGARRRRRKNAEIE